MGSLILEDLRDNASGKAYPRQALRGHRRALILFAAGFLGRQDAFWVADAGMDATCVDVDEGKLRLMETLYPPSWAFVESDAFLFAESERALARTWDVVSLDPPTNLFDDCAQELPTWCGLAEHVVILGVGKTTQWTVPDGWYTADVRERSMFRGGVYWAVIRKRPPL